MKLNVLDRTQEYIFINRTAIDFYHGSPEKIPSTADSYIKYQFICRLKNHTVDSIDGSVVDVKRNNFGLELSLSCDGHRKKICIDRNNVPEFLKYFGAEKESDMLNKNAVLYVDYPDHILMHAVLGISKYSPRDADGVFSGLDFDINFN